MESNKGFFRGSIEKMLSELLLLPSLKFTSENGWLESTTLGAMLVFRECTLWWFWETLRIIFFGCKTGKKMGKEKRTMVGYTILHLVLPFVMGSMDSPNMGIPNKKTNKKSWKVTGFGSNICGSINSEGWYEEPVLVWFKVASGD